MDENLIGNDIINLNINTVNQLLGLRKIINESEGIIRSICRVIMDANNVNCDYGLTPDCTKLVRITKTDGTIKV